MDVVTMRLLTFRVAVTILLILVSSQLSTGSLTHANTIVIISEDAQLESARTAAQTLRDAGHDVTVLRTSEIAELTTAGSTGASSTHFDVVLLWKLTLSNDAEGQMWTQMARQLATKAIAVLASELTVASPGWVTLVDQFMLVQRPDLKQELRMLMLADPPNCNEPLPADPNADPTLTWTKKGSSTACTFLDAEACDLHCVAQYQSNGTLVCETGKWKAGVPACIPKPCPAPTDLADRHLDWNHCPAEVASGHSCVPTCAADYYRNGTAFNCSFGEWVGQINCLAPCPPQTPPDHASRGGSCIAPIFHHGESCSFTCASKYSVHPNIIHCVDGQWNTNQFCVGDPCPGDYHSEEHIDNGKPGTCINTTITPSGSWCSLDCDPGYTAEPLHRTCDLGEWIPSLGQVCLPSPCPAMTIPPENGDLGTCGTRTASGNDCEFSCHPNYDRIGESMHCIKGSWSETKQTCVASSQGNPCPPMATDLEGGDWGTCRKQTMAGSTCKPYCFPGYELTLPAMLCLNGKFVNISTCQGQSCLADPYPVDHGWRDSCNASIPHGSSCSVKCDANYMPVPQKILCEGGRKIPAGPQRCLLIPCKPLAPPDLVGSGNSGNCSRFVLPGDHCTYNCSKGFEQVLDPPKCGLGGNWSDPQNTSYCQPAHCDIGKQFAGAIYNGSCPSNVLPHNPDYWCFFNCSTGYTKNLDYLVRCQYGQIVSDAPTLPECIKNDEFKCVSPAWASDAISNGTCDHLLRGQFCSIECDSDFEAIPSRVYCGKNGQFEQNQICKRKSCTYKMGPFDPERMKGIGDCVHVPMDEYCHVDCKEGYDAAAGQCGANGWIEPPKCHDSTGKSCTLNPVPAGAQVGSCAVVRPTKDCHFTCNQRPNGELWYAQFPVSGNLSCIEEPGNNHWDVPNPSCIPILGALASCPPASVTITVNQASVVVTIQSMASSQASEHTPEPCSVEHADLAAYTVQWWALNITTRQQDVSISGATTTFTITELMGGLNYSVQVQGHNGSRYKPSEWIASVPTVLAVKDWRTSESATAVQVLLKFPSAAVVDKYGGDAMKTLHSNLARVTDVPETRFTTPELQADKVTVKFVVVPPKGLEEPAISLADRIIFMILHNSDSFKNKAAVLFEVDKTYATSELVMLCDGKYTTTECFTPPSPPSEPDGTSVTQVIMWLLVAVVIIMGIIMWRRGTFPCGQKERVGFQHYRSNEDKGADHDVELAPARTQASSPASSRSRPAQLPFPPRSVSAAINIPDPKVPLQPSAPGSAIALVQRVLTPQGGPIAEETAKLRKLQISTIDQLTTLDPSGWTKLNLLGPTQRDVQKELEQFRSWSQHQSIDAFAGFETELKTEAKAETTDAAMAQLEEDLFATVTSSGIPKLTAPPADGAVNPPRKSTKGRKGGAPKKKQPEEDDGFTNLASRRAPGDVDAFVIGDGL